jgi:hypothetical protein
MRRTTIAVVLAVLGGGSAWAQEEADAHPTAVSVIGGISVGSTSPFGIAGFHFGGSDGAAFAVGGSIAHDLTPRLTLEGSGLWLDRGASAWSADAGLRVNLRPSSESLVPYFAVSGGLYGESYDTIQGPGGINVPLPRGNTTLGRVGQVVRGFLPDGRDRDEDYLFSSGSSHRTDGMLTFGGGVRLASGEHVFVRPDARAQVVFGSDTRILGLFTLNFGYRF